MRLKEQEKQNKRTEIISVARKCFSEKGFEQTSISEIAKKVKIAKGTVYLYFESKLDLFLEIIQFAREKMINKAKRISSDSNLSSSEKLKALTKIHLELIEEYPEYPKIFSMITHHADAELKKRIRDMFFTNQDDDPIQLIQKIFQEGVSRNEFKPEINIQEETFRIYFISRVFSITMGILIFEEGVKTWPFLPGFNGEKVMWDTLDMIISQYKN